MAPNCSGVTTALAPQQGRHLVHRFRRHAGLLEERDGVCDKCFRSLHECGRHHEALPELVVAEPPATAELEDLEPQPPVPLVAFSERGARGGVEGRPGARVDEVAPVPGGVARRPEALHVLDQELVALLLLVHHRLGHRGLPALRLQRHRDDQVGVRQQVMLREQALERPRQSPGHFVHPHLTHLSGAAFECNA
eukprot:CAMPEP_0179226802 /NCGR_PEP_ID=MMETSP0797-20121207/8997_1 /TAXON_ID=47934 /ORGANISM="Dinophysis acuminata, Strain DAEP01" /LENGTH=193 /DNA_ID=CAMNT_0020933833 /DNA_START=328 /DNA_END=905 /DNA_ORIENTATION=-